MSQTSVSGPAGPLDGDLGRTLAAMTTHRWSLVLCRPRSKAPAITDDGHWQTTDDPDHVRHHVEGGGNIGLCSGSRSNLVLLDPDNLEEWARLMRCLGSPAKAWVRTGSGRVHHYAAWEPLLPAKLSSIDGAQIGEIQRGGADGLGQQHCVLPPSIHPDTGQAYVWLVDPATEPVAPLPELWRRWLLPLPAPTRSYSRRDGRHRPTRDRPGAVLEAVLPPGGVRRPGGRVKFPCPQCRADGHDAHGDNAIVFADGRFGCAWATGNPTEARRHRQAIARLLREGA